MFVCNNNILFVRRSKPYFNLDNYSEIELKLEGTYDKRRTGEVLDQPPISLEEQIPLELEVKLMMLLHACFDADVHQLLTALEYKPEKPTRGTSTPDMSKLNALHTVNHPLSTYYLMLVKSDRQSTVEAVLGRNDHWSVHPEQALRNRRWLTALRLYGGIMGLWPHASLSTDGRLEWKPDGMLTHPKWSNIARHYRGKVSRVL